jgi:hypothetical protein
MPPNEETRWPDVIGDEATLDDLLTQPTPALVRGIKAILSPLLVLGAGGKMGPTLAVRAKRAAEAAGHPLDVIAVSRFTDANSREWLESHGVRTVTGNLLDQVAVNQLPDAQNLIYLVGLKFGTSQNSPATWALNTLVPAKICERYPRSRVVALSTGNVYPFGDITRGGSVETDSLTPLGEYANAAIGRERIFEYYSRSQGPEVALLRLFYAVELRYGVLVDIARMVNIGVPVPLETGAFNCIWQGDANEMILRALPLVARPPSVWNMCQPEVFSVRETAVQFGELLGRKPVFSGRETGTALLGNPAKLCQELGKPAVPQDRMLRWIAHWVKLGGRDLGRRTHFEVRNGVY